MNKKMMYRLGTLALTFLMLPTSSLAQGIDTTTIDEKWGKPAYVYGESLSQDQITETAKLLGIQDMENVNAMPVSHDDLVRILNQGSGGSSNMISSVLVKREDKGSGVSVQIETPKNITEITQEQYENAAITAGVSDATILVAAIRPVTGESALTGVYKAFEANGEALDTERMKVAQEELDTVNMIVQDNKSVDGFDEKNLNKVIVEVKQALSDIKEKQKDLASKEDIERIINEALEKYSLREILSQDQVDRLIQLFLNYQNTNAIDSQEVKEQLKQLGSEIGTIVGDAVDKAKESGLWDQMVQFFQDLFDKILALFSN